MFTISDIPHLYGCEFKYIHPSTTSNTVYKMHRLDDRRMAITWDGMTVDYETQTHIDTISCLNKGLWQLTNNSERLFKIRKLRNNG